jgi:hypothetical protein
LTEREPTDGDVAGGMPRGAPGQLFICATTTVYSIHPHFNGQHLL